MTHKVDQIIEQIRNDPEVRAGMGRIKGALVELDATTRPAGAWGYLYGLAIGDGKTVVADGDGSLVRTADGEPLMMVDHKACLPGALFWLKSEPGGSRQANVSDRVRRARVYEYVLSLAEGHGKTVLRRKDGMVVRDDAGNPILVTDHRACAIAAIWWVKTYHGWREGAAARELETPQ